MYNALLQIILFASLGVVVYILTRALPRVSDEKTVAGRHGDVFDRLLKRLPVARVDTHINQNFERLLRRLRSLLLKSDNVLHQRLERLKRSNRTASDADERPDLFKRLNGGTKE